MIERPRAAIASRVALAMLGAIFVSACDKDAKREAPKDAALKLAPVIIVTKTEGFDAGVLDRDTLVHLAGSGAPEPTVQVGCDAVAAKVPSVLFAIDPGYFTFAAKIRPKVRESCIDDAWPEALRRCIVTTAPDTLVHDRACAALVPDELVAKLATRFGVAQDQVRAMLER